MDLDWAFPIQGATAGTARAVELELRAIEGMITANVDVRSSLARVRFDADTVCGGEILAVLSECGCVPTGSSTRATTPETDEASTPNRPGRHASLG